MWPTFGALLQTKAPQAKQNISVFSLLAHARWFTRHHSNMLRPHIHHHLAEVAKALPRSSSQGRKHWWVQVLFLAGVETFGIYCTEEKPSPVTEAPTGLSVPPRQGTQHGLHRSCSSPFSPHVPGGHAV